MTFPPLNFLALNGWLIFEEPSPLHAGRGILPKWPYKPGQYAFQEKPATKTNAQRGRQPEQCPDVPPDRAGHRQERVSPCLAGAAVRTRSFRFCTTALYPRSLQLIFAADVHVFDQLCMQSRHAGGCRFSLCFDLFLLPVPRRHFLPCLLALLISHLCLLCPPTGNC